MEDVMTSNGSVPLFYIVPTNGTYKVILYLPDPSDVSFTLSASSSVGQEEGGMDVQILVIVGLIMIVLVLAMVAVFAFIKLGSSPLPDRDWKAINKQDLDIDTGRMGSRDGTVWDDVWDHDLSHYIGTVLNTEDPLPMRHNVDSTMARLRKRRDKGDLSDREYRRYASVLERIKEE
jgi:uncharacterized membrane protein